MTAVWTTFGATYLTGTLQVGQPILHGVWNTYVRDNLQYLFDRMLSSGKISAFGSPVPIEPSARASAGTISAFARGGHVHQTPARWPLAVSVGGIAIGVRDVINFGAATVTSATLSGGVTGLTVAANAEGGTNFVFAPQTLIPAASAPGDSVDTGSVAVFANSDHFHPRETSAAPATIIPGSAGAVGTATSLSLGDHVHGVPAAWPATWVGPTQTTSGQSVMSSAIVDFVATGDYLAISGEKDSANGWVNLTLSSIGTASSILAYADGTGTGQVRAGLNFIPGAQVSLILEVSAEGSPASTNALNLKVSTQIAYGQTTPVTFRDESARTTLPANINQPYVAGTSYPGTTAFSVNSRHTHVLDIPSLVAVASGTVVPGAVASAGSGTGALVAGSSHRHATPAQWPLTIRRIVAGDAVYTSATRRDTLDFLSGTNITAALSNPSGIATVTLTATPSASTSARVFLDRKVISGNGTASVTFSPISQSYRHLEMHGKGRIFFNTSYGEVQVQIFGADPCTTYRREIWYPYTQTATLRNESYVSTGSGVSSIRLGIFCGNGFSGETPPGHRGMFVARFWNYTLAQSTHTVTSSAVASYTASDATYLGVTDDRYDAEFCGSYSGTAVMSSSGAIVGLAVKTGASFFADGTVFDLYGLA